MNSIKPKQPGCGATTYIILPRLPNQIIQLVEFGLEVCNMPSSGKGVLAYSDWRAHMEVASVKSGFGHFAAALSEAF